MFCHRTWSLAQSGLLSTGKFRSRTEVLFCAAALHHGFTMQPQTGRSVCCCWEATACRAAFRGRTAASFRKAPVTPLGFHRELEQIPAVMVVLPGDSPTYDMLAGPTTGCFSFVADRLKRRRTSAASAAPSVILPPGRRRRPRCRAGGCLGCSSYPGGRRRASRSKRCGPQKHAATTRMSPYFNLQVPYLQTDSESDALLLEAFLPWASSLGSW